MSHEDYVELVRARASNAARRFIAGEASLVEAVREIYSCLDELDDPNLEELTIAFAGFSSETHHVPVGSARNLWAADALQRIDQEVGEIESTLSSTVYDACNRLLGQLEPAA